MDRETWIVARAPGTYRKHSGIHRSNRPEARAPDLVRETRLWLIPIVSFIGHHDAGKTRLMGRLIRVFSDRGIRIGAVKHAPHLEIPGAPGTDSHELQSAGATRTLLLSRNTAVLTWPYGSLADVVEDVERLFSGCDMILVEGLKRGPFPKIEVFRRTGHAPQEPLAGEIDVIAVVTDAAIAVPDGTASFSPRDADGIADFLETQFLQA
jgi:molybdopterin-guanine dinucleotide biosynthesis adapter protein